MTPIHFTILKTNKNAFLINWFWEARIRTDSWIVTPLVSKEEEV
jgi:hypothetical protein